MLIKQCVPTWFSKKIFIRLQNIYFYAAIDLASQSLLFIEMKSYRSNQQQRVRRIVCKLCEISKESVTIAVDLFYLTSGTI